MIDPYTGCPDRLVEPPEENRPHVDVCCLCDEPIYQGDTYFDFSGDFVCRDCLTLYESMHRKEAHA